MRKILLACILAACLISWLGPSLGNATPASPQHIFHTQSVDIIYAQDADLDELARRLGAMGQGSPPQPDAGLLAAKIDAMLADISRILQKWPVKPVKLQIRLLRDGYQVRQQQLALKTALPERGAPGRPYLESYYEPSWRTIFLSLADARPGILAHEMAHFILCESSPANASEVFQETLAQYIEKRFNAAKEDALRPAGPR